ncbi:hypothetical protein NDN08_005609 [Rhodosorus marinus]|uniref:Uncharacterized protein n=1 Tax=Rhodosorus marinus TaxID=101924 RepID=A0AAV8V4Y8_9RHOD|nr:hypothetical protein NDN08_005609 [Rhodosorus marinus]
MGNAGVERLLVANRGEIARRIFRTARRLGIECVAVYSDADDRAAHVSEADYAVRIGPARALDSYLNIDAILKAAKASGADAVHPGYGFLSENSSFARACATSKLNFIGPPVEAIEKMGSKAAARQLMSDGGVPVIPGYHGEDQTDERLFAEAKSIGFPVLIKPVMGGGGKGMYIVYDENDLGEALKASRGVASSAFGDSRVLLEKYIAQSRHVEVQIFGDKHGNHVHLWERDCSVQRRHQKIIEEAPAPDLGDSLRSKFGRAAVAAAKQVKYENAGTVEFILDVSDGKRDFYFLEMNTRLQVEHPVTEEITGQDLVEWQLRVARGERLPITEQSQIPCRGHAIEARIYAESPEEGFLPQAGTVNRFRFPGDPAHVRVDSGIREGDSVGVFYDPMVAKVIATGDSRAEAMTRLRNALRGSQVLGIKTNCSFVSKILSEDEFVAGTHDTSILEKNMEKLLKSSDQESKPPGALLAAALTRRLVLLEHYKQINGHNAAFKSNPGFALFDAPRTLVRIDGKEVVVEETSEQVFDVREGDDVIGSVVLHSCRSVGSDEFELDVSVKGVRLKWHTVQAGSEIGVYSFEKAGQVFTGDPEEEEEQEHDHEDGTESSIKAPLPGLIKAVMVQVGDLVQKDDVLVNLEAMKMAHSLKSPHAGVVKHLHTAEGEIVTFGKALVSVQK